MQVGPNNWRCVSIDEPMVPRGGMYGDVDEFAAKADRHGLKLCWNWGRKCFCAYTVHYGREVFLWRFWNERTRAPEPLTDYWLWLLVTVRERHGRLDGESFAQTAARAAAEEDAAVAAKVEADHMELLPDLHREVQYNRGRTRPLTLIMPGRRGRLGRKAAMQ